MILATKNLKPDNKRKQGKDLAGLSPAEIAELDRLYRLEKQGNRKYQSVLFNAIDRFPDNFIKSQRCKDCGNFLLFDNYQHKQTKEQKRTLARANFCGIRHCPTCMANKTSKVAREIYSIFEQITNDIAVDFVFLTLTIKNDALEKTRDNAKLICKAWHRLVQTKRWLGSVLGFVRGIEFKGDKTPKDECHVHFHCTLIVKAGYYHKDSPYYITHAQWVEMWQKALRVDYKPSVRVSAPKPKEKGKNALLSAVVECVKYSIKPSQLIELDQEQFKIFDEQTRGLRQYNKGGIVKDKRYKPKDTKELDPEIWEKIGQEYYKWYGSKEGYQRPADRLKKFKEAIEANNANTPSTEQTTQPIPRATHNQDSIKQHIIEWLADLNKPDSTEMKPPPHAPPD
ncbi:hypothetical protein NHP200010_15790 [Helicobacter bizzozeronii]|uniref:protein rep n=1 Tax=Helicobacter bizzozeronii TaxID=56877 RepID=UPI00244D951B|nr:protein rep [Helicobacter bizzozeronii]GMB93846.1 hypothetical protein NHP200010_15790 [Helicobacter bizzozeronii]